MRGVQVTGAVTLIAARSDLTLFDHPRQLMSDSGLPPSEDASGERRRQGTITTAGNTFARRAFIEGVWSYRYPAKEGQPSSPHALGEVTEGHLEHCLERPGPLVQAFPTPHGTQKESEPGGCGHRAGNGRFHLGHHPQGAHDSLPWGRAVNPYPSGGTLRPFGGEAAPVWCNPRWREAAARNPRA
jgi:hypothetical protein